MHMLDLKLVAKRTPAWAHDADNRVVLDAVASSLLRLSLCMDDLTI